MGTPPHWWRRLNLGIQAHRPMKPSAHLSGTNNIEVAEACSATFHVNRKSSRSSDPTPSAQPGSTPDSSPGTPPAPPCATPTVHTDRRNSTLKNAAHHHGGCATRRCYSRFTARPTVAGDTPKDLATRLWLTPLATISMAAGQPAGSAQFLAVRLRLLQSFLPSAFAFSKPALVRRRIDTSSWSDTQAAKPAKV